MVEAAIFLVALPNQRKRFTPVTLPTEQPIAQLVVDGAFAEAFGFEPGSDFLFGFGGWEARDGDFRAG